MKNALRPVLAVAGAAALVSIGTAAYAGPPWTVSIGGSSTGAPAAYTASTVGASPQINFTTPAANLGCASGTAAGTITPGATTGAVGSITSSTFNSCSGPLGLTLNVTQNSAWAININGNQVGGVTPGNVSTISASVSDGSGLCSFDVTGTVPGSFNQNTQQLTVNGGGLSISNVNGCFGVINEGDPATFAATYQLAGIGAVTIAN